MSVYSGPIRGVCEGIFDGPHATPKESDDGPVFLGISNVKADGRMDLSEIRHVSEQDFPRWTRRVVPRHNDIVFSYEATLHRYALIPEDFRGCLGRRMALIRVDQNKVDPRYLLYYCLSPQWRTVIDGNIIKGATVDRIPLKTFPNFPIRIPPRDQQTRIAERLEAFDALIENNQRRIALLEEAARLLYREWFVHFRFPGHEHVKIIDGLPEGWERRALELVCSDGNGIQTGPFGSQLHQSDYSDTGVPVVMPKDLISFRIDSDEVFRIPESFAEKLSRHRMIDGDTVYGRRGDIGRRGFVSAKQTGWLCGTGCLRIRPNRKEIDPRFLFDALGAPDTTGTIANRAKGATMLNLNATLLKSVPVLVPPRSLQALYTEQVQPMTGLIELLSEQNTKLKFARDLLLPRLMKGEIAV
jgi:type I restriction enzyme, S subunit